MNSPGKTDPGTSRPDQTGIFPCRDSEEQGKGRRIRQVTWAGLFTNLLLAGFKFAGGILGNSHAVVADAVHSLSDISTDIVILFGVRYWTRPADSAHPYGHRRIETLVTLTIGLVLAGTAAVLLRNGLLGLATASEEPKPGWVAFAAALISVLTKEGLYRWTVTEGRRLKSGALIANAWHHRTDALSSIPAVLAVLGATLLSGWQLLDYLGVVAVSIFIFYSAFKICYPPLMKLADTGLPEKQLAAVREAVLKVNGVRNVHRVRSRHLGCSAIAVDLHVEVDPDLTVREGHDITLQIQNDLGDDTIVDVIVHVEPFEDADQPDVG